MNVIVINGRRVMRIETVEMLLGISRRHIYNLVKADLLESARVGTVYLFFEDSVLDLKAAREAAKANHPSRKE